MTVGRPCVEREKRAKYAKTHKGQREEISLCFDRNMSLRNFKQIHSVATCKIVNAKYAHEQQRRTSHQHQGQFHC
jgi:hypothetical protein